MPPFPSFDGTGDRWAPFSCRWRDEGDASASVQVSGDLDLATSGQLVAVLREAFGCAGLVLLDVREVSFVDSTGLHAILDAAARARAEGGRLIVSGASPQVDRLFDITGTRAQVVLLNLPPHADEAAAPRAEQGWASPLDNPVNARVVSARVMAVSEATLWIQAADGPIHRPWTPPVDAIVVPSGTPLEVYLDAAGDLNGWYEPQSGFAVNQRGLGAGESPASFADLACEGSCGVVWHAPAADRLAERGERCLTCAGPLVLQ